MGEVRTQEKKMLSKRTHAYENGMGDTSPF